MSHLITSRWLRRRIIKIAVDIYVINIAILWDGYDSWCCFISPLTGEPLVLDELVISHPVVNLERNSQETSNLKDISENAEKNQDEADRKSAEEEPASEEKPGEPFRIIIRRLVIEGVTLNVRLADGTTRSGTLPSIELTDVGGDGGVTPGGLGHSASKRRCM